METVCDKIEAHPSLGDVCGPATFSKRGIGSYMHSRNDNPDYGISMMERGNVKGSAGGNNLTSSKGTKDDDYNSSSQAWSTIADPRAFAELSNSWDDPGDKVYKSFVSFRKQHE